MTHAAVQEAYRMRQLEADPDEWRRRSYRAQANFRARHPEKKLAWDAVYRAVKAGRLVRPGECDKCQKECVPEASHHDYTKPLEVEWLCKPCHTIKDTSLRRRN